MKKLLVWCLVLTMVISTVVFPVSIFATETTEDTTTGDTTTEGTDTETETTTSKQVVHVDMSYEENTTRTAFHYLSEDVTDGAGSWSATSGAVGKIVNSVDGNAFSYTKSSGYALYKPTTKWSSGKILFSADVSYDPLAPAGRQTWVMTNGFTKTDGTTDSEYIWIAALETTTKKGPCMYGISSSSSSSSIELFKSTSTDEVYTVDIVVDLDAKTRTWYTNGEYKGSNKMNYTGIQNYTPGISQIKFNMTKNVTAIDNFRIIENPDAKYSFSQKGEVTTQSEYIRVRFSDTVHLTDITDFIITDTNGETAATVTEIKQINGKFYDLKLSNKLNPGTYNLKLNDTTLTSVIAETTSSNTTSEFTVTPEYTYFDIDFEEFTNSGATSYFSSFSSDLGTMALPSGGSCDFVSSNTYQFEGDSTKGVAGSGAGTTKRLNYYIGDDLTTGTIKVSFDAAFDSTKKAGRGQLLFLNDDTTNGNIMFYGTTKTSKVIASVNESLTYRDASDNIAYEDNKPYRWDVVMDLDAKTLTHYRDGVQFGKLTYTRNILPVSQISLYLTPAFTFFDNYKLTVNVDTFAYTATDIGKYSNTTVVNFDDTMDLADTDLTFTDPDGNTVTPTSIKKITPRKYEVTLPDLMEGTYKVALAEGKTSAIENTAKIESATFNVEARPESEFYATSLAFADVEGGITLTSKLTNTTDADKNALLVIAVYDEEGMIDCAAQKFPIVIGETNVEKTITLTTEADLSQYKVRGYVWNIDDNFYPLFDGVTR